MSHDHQNLSISVGLKLIELKEMLGLIDQVALSLIDNFGRVAVSEHDLIFRSLFSDILFHLLHTHVLLHQRRLVFDCNVFGLL